MTSTATSAEHGSPRIARMPDDLANQIAAGEVVERPASAVKELVENAIDAGARRIRVDIEEGGLRLIRVTDDGRGMDRDDAALCIERHATSKLTSPDQLFAISTLGFRGEALPSIASVSRFRIHTKPHGRIGGTRVTVVGGAPAEVGDAGCPAGTEIEVRELFFNTPARLKFLKTRSTELKHCIEAVQRLALPNPDVGFVVTHNGRTVVELPAVEDWSDRVYGVVGDADARHLYPVNPAEQDGATCVGFYGAPALTRRTAAGVWTFVNGRFVRDRTISSAIRAGYEGMLDRGRHPVVVLAIEVPPRSVDVNVHPMKIEVRFHDASSVFRAVRRAVATSLAEAPWVGDEMRSATKTAAQDEAIDAPTQEHIPVRSYTLHSARAFGEAAPAPSEALTQRVSPAPEVAAVPDAGFFASLHYIGQFRGTYLLANDAHGIVVVDQHAAHERITYEVLRRAWTERRRERQPMLFPAVLHLDSLRSALLADHVAFFEAVGFEIEPFGGTDWALKAVPSILSRARADALIRDALDELAEAGSSTRIHEAADAVLLRMACHGSIRAGDAMTEREVHALFAQLDRIDFGGNCPHGRPVYFRMTLDELERRFERR